MVSFEWDPDNVPVTKLGIHCAQIVLAFVGWCLQLAVFTGDGAKIVGDNGWNFGVYFLSIPAWIYLIGTPRFERTVRFANVYAMLTVDSIFTIIWLSAFAAQASYNAKDLCGSRCGVSKSVVAIGVLVTLLWGASTFVSAYTMTYFNFHGNLPGYGNRKIRSGSNEIDNIDPDKEAFSMAPHDDEAYERVHMDDHHDTSYGGGSRYGDLEDPNRYGSMPPPAPHHGEEAYDGSTTYHAGSSYSSPPPPQGTYSDEPAKFPAGHYDRTL